MECKEIKELFDLYIDNEIKEKDRKLLVSHLESCDECKKELAEYMALSDKVQGLEVLEVPEGFHSTLMEKIKEENKANPVKVKKEKKKFNFNSWGTIAACFIVVVIATSVQKFSPSTMDYSMDEAVAGSDVLRIAAESDMNMAAENDMGIARAVNETVVLNSMGLAEAESAAVNNIFRYGLGLENDSNGEVVEVLIELGFEEVLADNEHKAVLASFDYSAEKLSEVKQRLSLISAIESNYETPEEALVQDEKSIIIVEMK